MTNTLDVDLIKHWVTVLDLAVSTRVKDPVAGLLMKMLTVRKIRLP